MADDDQPSGTGYRLGHAIITLAGVAALAGTVMTFVSIWLQSKNYRKPLLQRYVIRILIMIPIYSLASWSSLVSLNAAFWIDPFKDVYEAFTIYAFFQLLINFLGGERSLIIMMTGRAPVAHPWPLNRCLPKIDISDPHTFLMVKRGILQYTWVKPLLAVATIAMKATGTYQEGYVGLKSGYLWSGVIYNISITVSLYALAMFWVCMTEDLKPFRPMPKFLCIKGIIFASYWQGFLLSIFVWLGAIPDSVPGYTPDNLAAAIQDALICFEMPAFAVAHWYAFSWHDYADRTISAARMPVRFALRDAFGARDLIRDAKDTFAGSKYDYRHFDAGENIIAHEESRQRAARMKQGMRYARDGKGKYWLPKPGQADSKTPLLKPDDNGRDRSASPVGSPPRSANGYYGAIADDDDFGEEPTLVEEDEDLYTQARTMEFGDWNYPVVTAHFATREDRLYETPDVISASTNRNILQPTEDNRRRRKSQIERLQDGADKGKLRQGSSGRASGSRSRSRRFKEVPRVREQEEEEGQERSKKLDRSQLVDLVIEDHDAEEIERVRARKEGSPEWNKGDAKHFVRTYPDAPVQEEVREGYEPHAQASRGPVNQHAVDQPINEDKQATTEEVAAQWKQREYTEEDDVDDRHHDRDDDDDGDDDDEHGGRQTPHGNDGEAGVEGRRRQQQQQEDEEDNPWNSPSRR